mmetsp:Transcript_13643/g.26733  ORF Transcript_13643/g.26733 Transcript_13643/m.26733 type:complete len:319 (+) Transcript_13643:82-1038(+)
MSAQAVFMPRFPDLDEESLDKFFSTYEPELEEEYPSITVVFGPNRVKVPKAFLGANRVFATTIKGDRKCTSIDMTNDLKGLHDWPVKPADIKCFLRLHFPLPDYEEVVVLSNFIALAALANKYDVRGMARIVARRAEVLMKREVAPRDRAGAFFGNGPKKPFPTSESVVRYLNALADLGLSEVLRVLLEKIDTFEFARAQLIELDKVVRGKAAFSKTASEAMVRAMLQTALSDVLGSAHAHGDDLIRDGGVRDAHGDGAIVELVERKRSDAGGDIFGGRRDEDVTHVSLGGADEALGGTSLFGGTGGDGGAGGPGGES